MLAGQGAAFDVDALTGTISGLGKREFVLHTTKGTEPKVFTTRWALDYLAGPLTKDQVGSLPGQPDADTVASAATSAAPAAAPADERPVEVADDEVTVAPEAADGVTVRWIDPAAPWLPEVGGDPDSTSKFQDVQYAYSVLSDPQLRGVYDSYGEQGLKMYESYMSFADSGTDGGPSLPLGAAGFEARAAPSGSDGPGGAGSDGSGGSGGSGGTKVSSGPGYRSGRAAGGALGDAEPRAARARETAGNATKFSRGVKRGSATKKRGSGSNAGDAVDAGAKKARVAVSCASFHDDEFARASRDALDLGGGATLLALDPGQFAAAVARVGALAEET